FTGRAPASVPLATYAERLARYAPAPPAVWIAALVAIDRIANAPATPASSSSASASSASLLPSVVVCSANVHRLLLVAFVVASKAHSDVFYSNRHLARVGGVPLTELNALEIEYLFLGGFSVNVSRSEFARYAHRLAAYANAVRKQQSS
ncbi:cyclin PHO80-like protein, partial [Blastocladiella britannica]